MSKDMIIELFGVPACGKSTYIKKYEKDDNFIVALCVAYLAL